MNRKNFVWTLVALFGLGTQVAQATPVFFDFSGSCAFDCSEIDANDGDAVSGFFETTEAAVLSGVIDTAEIIDFGFSLGSVSLDSVMGIVNFSNLVLNGAGDGFIAGRITVLQGLSVFLEFEIVDMWRYAEAGQELTGGDGSFNLRAQAVPEPGTLLLMGLGLIAGFLGMRRRA